MTTIAELRVAADPEAWRSVGFTVDEQGDGQIGMVRLDVGMDDGRPGLRSWALAAAPDRHVTDVDGLPTGHAEPPLLPAAVAEHVVGAIVVDHLVVVTPDLPRTIGAVERDLGLPLLRTRDSDTYGAPMRQAFFRMGEVVLEVVGAPEPDPRGGPARFYGIAITVADLDGVAARLGDLIGPPKAAVQPGRSIATIRREARLGTRVALMSPEP
jgi:hypothetical protein